MIAEFKKARAIRMTPAMDAWVIDQAAKRGVSTSDVVRTAIKAAMSKDQKDAQSV